VGAVVGGTTVVVVVGGAVEVVVGAPVVVVVVSWAEAGMLISPRRRGANATEHSSAVAVLCRLMSMGRSLRRRWRLTGAQRVAVRRPLPSRM
jgi:hypothetical protein